MWEKINDFFGVYGFSFVMMFIIGLAVALFTELTVKNGFAWLETKFDEKGKKTLAAMKIVAVLVITIGQCALYTKLLVAAMPLPGGAVFYPVWMTLVYAIQYIFSLFGIKGIIDWAKRKEEKAEARKSEKAKAEAEKPVLNLVPGTVGLYTDGKGNFFDKKGNRL